MKQNNQVVYLHTLKDKPSHVFYVGEGLPRRPGETRRNNYWKRIVAKHGYDIHIVATGLSKHEAIELEVYLTNAYKSIGMAEAVIQIGGDSNKVTSEATKLKLKKAMTGRILSDEWKKKISKAHLGRKPTPETLLKIKQNHARLGQFGKNHNRSKATICIVNGVVIAEYGSTLEAERVTGLSDISSGCKGRRLTVGVYNAKTKEWLKIKGLNQVTVLQEHCYRATWAYK